MDFSANYGDVIDVSIDYAARMVSTGQAEYADPDIRNAMATPDTEKKVINKSGKK
jgi:hypothetical protein